MKNKTNRILKKIIIGCIAIILLEFIIMAIMKVTRERKLDRVNYINDIIKVDDGYVTVGISDFHDSDFVSEKLYEYKSSEGNVKKRMIASQSRIAKFDDEMNLLWERTYEDTKYDSTYYDVLNVSDGYVAVGSVVNDYKQLDANTRDAIIVKYDLNGKVMWKNTYTVLSDTEFYKIIMDDDNYVVIGQSIYENMEMGTHTTGGGIIVRYNSDGEEIAHNNYGGNKSGIFNDIIKVSDGYIVCGKDAANYGIIVKFKKDFNREENDSNIISDKVMWQRVYSNTDTIGFTSMVLIGDKIYSVGALNVSNEKDDNEKTIFKYDAGMVIYNTSGKYIGKALLEEDAHHRFNSVIKDADSLILTGLLDVDNKSEDKKQNSFTIKYDLKEEKFVEKQIGQEESDYIISKIVDLNNKKYLIGTSKSNCGLLGCDYEVFVKEYKKAS